MPAFFLALSGCASVPDSARTLSQPDNRIELANTPFFPQERYQCGPAALATVLQVSGIDIQPDDLVSTVYLPGRQGSLQVDMLAATRQAGRIPYLLDASLTAVTDELQDGRPVVVLQNLGVSMIPRWHYAVVIGVDGPNDNVILRSGTDERRETPVNVFLRTWSRGDFWAFSVLQPGELPTAVNRKRYVTAVVDLENVGMYQEAAAAWRAALDKWPADTTAQFGLGNSLLELGQFGEAERAYRELLAAKPGLAAARNNLAVALQKQGLLEQAKLEIEQAIQQTEEPALLEELLDTRRDIERLMSASR